MAIRYETESAATLGDRLLYLLGSAGMAACIVVIFMPWLVAIAGAIVAGVVAGYGLFRLVAG